MCKFFSVLVLRDGSVRHHPMLDSHSDLVRYFQMPDADAFVHHFAKAELTPVDDWTDASTWQWRIDEDVWPVWLTDDIAASAEAATRAIAQRMVINNVARDFIVDGCWIIAGTSKVRDVRSGRIVRVQDSASISHVWGSASISHVWGSASISDVGGSASIRDVWGSASIRNVGDSASISNVGGSASIRNVGDSASISHVGGSASIRDVWGSASIRNVGDSASISNVGGSASIRDVGDSALRDASARAHVK